MLVMPGVVIHGWTIIISTEDGNNVITNMYVLYGTVQSDHIPLVAHSDLQLAPDIDQGETNNIGNKIDWSILSEDILYEYGVQSEILLSNVEIPTDVKLYCAKTETVIM